MAISLKKCKGLWVTSLQNGKICGQLAGSVIDTKENTLVGFKVKPKRDLVLKELWLPVENIKKMGFDMVLITNESKLIPEALTGFNYERLANMPVSSKDGRALGELENIIIDEKTWTISEFELDGHMKVNVDSGETVLGEDIILIQPDAMPQKDSEKKEPKIKVEVSEVSEATSKVVKQGEAFVKKTGDVVRKVLRGSEANLRKVREKLAENNPENIADLSRKKTPKKDKEDE